MSDNQCQKAARVFLFDNDSFDEANEHRFVFEINKRFNVQFPRKNVAWEVRTFDAELNIIDFKIRVPTLAGDQNAAVGEVVDERARTSVEPPPLAEFFLGLCARTNSHKAVLGDLNETFNRNCAQLGRRRACRLYWAKALQSLLPLLWGTVGRLAKWAVIVDAIKRHFLS
jgi:hypothetical protein